ncbi:DNA repair protein RadA [uncultured Campylobacter sp.]|uniref:DNA repair protein RadA n=1 Tax=uncultured Campylobacter sp. TaxID=218934 RepID=UPI0026151B65|nr:DNA repair protein RadA [uncultured Campylobacter sp.]
MAKEKVVYECQHCGNQQSKWLGKCPDCGAWDSYIKLNKEQMEFIKSVKSEVSKPALAQSIDEIKIEEIRRTTTQDKELDIVLGGGVVEGSLILIGGSPGIGKSTLLLKIASNLSKDAKVLYVSGEESKSQIKLRADRIEAKEKNLFILTEILFQNIQAEIAKSEYKFVVIDSIQTIYSDEINSSPGTVTQVREITFELMRLAKSQNITIFIIGHITKEGSIAGPRILEHMVDVVLYFEGDSSKELRVLRSFKNRFGSTSEVGIFEMTKRGLISANDIGNKFFTRGVAVSGSAITVIMEGSRALSIEIQALVSQSSYPKRSSTGYDRNRLDMILALLERKIGLNLSGFDVFVNVIGGVKITETAADLAVVAAIISSFKNRPVSKDSVFIGEVSLNGEIRDIFNIDARIKEANMQKFKNAIIPSKPSIKTDIKLFLASEISQIIEWM